MPNIDFSHIVGYEKEDTTEMKKELACAGGLCELEDLAPGISSGSSHKHSESKLH